MLRALTAVLALLGAPLALLPASLLHVHADAGHRHAAHQHGPALHAHASGGGHAHQADGRPESARLEPCPTSAHMVGVSAGCLVPASPAPAGALVSVVAVLVLPESPPSIVGAFDERAHGPPIRQCSSPRAPPVIRAA